MGGGRKIFTGFGNDARAVSDLGRKGARELLQIEMDFCDRDALTLDAGTCPAVSALLASSISAVASLKICDTHAPSSNSDVWLPSFEKL
ncbi:hypothetical protein ACOJBM_00620 [Rhizobium beringeri]